MQVHYVHYINVLCALCVDLLLSWRAQCASCSPIVYADGPNISNGLNVTNYTFGPLQSLGDGVDVFPYDAV